MENHHAPKSNVMCPSERGPPTVTGLFSSKATKRSAAQKSKKMIDEGQGEELEKMMKIYVPMQRFDRPEEIANAVLWICGSASSYEVGFSETSSAGS
jgi:NAD(P)-dependent dehydrogenase (short-subunit alcohol dehydrogenase family)